MSKYFSISDLSSILNVSDTIIRRWCKSKKIQYGIINNKIKFSKEMIEKIIKWKNDLGNKKGRPAQETNINISKLSDITGASIEEIKKDISNKNIEISFQNGIYFFSIKQVDLAKKYYKSLNIKRDYTPSDIASLLNVEVGLIRFLSHKNLINFKKTVTGRIYFSRKEFILIESMIEKGFPLITKDLLKEYNNEKKNYYSSWYEENKKDVQRRRKTKTNRKEL